MQRTTLKFGFGGLSLIVATIFLATFLPANNAHAGAPLSGVITLDVQYVCHDGGNRGYNPLVLITRYAGLNRREAEKTSYWTSIPKAYYDTTECFDMSTKYISPGAIIYVWYSRDGGTRRCPHFRLRYAPNRTDIWIQNLGSTAFDVTCVAKWSLKRNVNSPQIRTLKVFQASEICHDGANRGAEARILVSDGKNPRWKPAGMTFKGYYTKTQCFKLPNLKNGTKVTVYHQRRQVGDGEDAGHVEWCDKFVVKINRKAKPMWVQTTGTTIFNMGCRARRNI